MSDWLGPVELAEMARYDLALAAEQVSSVGRRVTSGDESLVALNVEDPAPSFRPRTMPEYRIGLRGSDIWNPRLERLGTALSRPTSVAAERDRIHDRLVSTPPRHERRGRYGLDGSPVQHRLEEWRSAFESQS